MSWTWHYENADGMVVQASASVSQPFPTQADAETWVGESWRDLLESGVDQVSLYEEGRLVYGPMSLRPA